MKTASHFDYLGVGRVVISRGNPRGVKGGYKLYKKLAPTKELLQADLAIDLYRPRFIEETLHILDPAVVWSELHALHGPDVEPVLQCFERPPLNDCNFCHRRMVADWFASELGYVVDELPFGAR